MRIPIGYRLDTYIQTGVRIPVTVSAEYHFLLTGTTGSGKSTLLYIILYKTIQLYRVKGLDMQVCDLKNGFKALNGCMRYHSDLQAIIQTIDNFYESFQATLKSGVTSGKHILVIDEFLSLNNYMEALGKTDKDIKQAYQRIQMEITTLLAMGRSEGYTLICIVQQGNAKNFSSTADRENFGNKIALGTQSKISAEMIFDMVDLSNINYLKPMRPGCGYVYVQGETVKEFVVPRLLNPEPLEQYVRNFLME